MKSFKRGEPIQVLRFDRRGAQAVLFQNVEHANFLEYVGKNQCTIVNQTGRVETLDLANIVIEATDDGGKNEPVA